jgi:hypothetical protein
VECIGPALVLPLYEGTTCGVDVPASLQPHAFFVSGSSFFSAPHLSVTMAASTSTICQPLSDTRTYTYSDLDNGFTPPSSCLGHSFTSAPDGYDCYVSSTTGSKTKMYISLDVYRGRDPACFPPNFPAACSYTGTFAEAAGNIYVDAPALPQSSTEVTGRTWSEKNYVYSPATCPESYAAMSTRTDATAGNVTSAICCPMYVCRSDILQRC